MAKADFKSYDYGTDLTVLTEAYKCKKRLSYFVKEFWDVVIPNKLIWNWHMDVLCDEIQTMDSRIFKGEPKLYDIVFNVPPGMSKTIITVVMANCWAYAVKPSFRTAVGSFSDNAVTGMSDYIKLIMRSEKYKLYFPETVVRIDKDNIHNFKTTANGEFYAFTVGGTITSKHFDKLTIDDPLNPKMAASAAQLETVNDFFAKTLPSRTTNTDMTPIQLTMQRLSVEDPSGVMISKPDTRHICLPAEISDKVSPIELKEFYIDGLLDPIRRSQKSLNKLRKTMGSVEAYAQLDQDPQPSGGTIIKKEWIRVVDIQYIPISVLDARADMFLDTALTSKTYNDPSGCMICVWQDETLYVLYYWHDWLEMHDLLNKIKQTSDNYLDDKSTIVVETNANGHNVVQELSRKFRRLNVIGVPKSEGKDVLLRLHAPKFECGKVIFIKGQWNEHVIAEITTFPAKHDESIDTITAALNRYSVPLVRPRRTATS